MFFFFNDTATSEIYTLSLHDALPIYSASPSALVSVADVELQPDPPAHWMEPASRLCDVLRCGPRRESRPQRLRSEEHTSELQSQSNLVCRLLLEKKKNHSINILYYFL